MDLNEFETRKKSEEGVEIELLSLKTRKGSGAFIKVHGLDSEQFATARVARARAISERMESGAEMTQADMDEARAQTLAACTIGWRGLMKDGKELPFSAQAALDLYRRYPAITEQIDRAIADRANFVGA